MKNLIINKIKFYIGCNDGSTYGINNSSRDFIQFNDGLNVIFGPNSVGKSSIITGIIYCLGAEKGLGIFQDKQNPFKPEFYINIDNKKIIQSYILLEISNGFGTITIKRNIINKTEICEVKKCILENYEKTQESEFFITEKEGVMTENGFQFYLFNFLDWDIVEVPKYEGKPSKIYLENLVPLFFVEQIAGWTQIQARQIMRYKIRDIKKISFEYIMGLDRFRIHLLELERRNLLEKIKEFENDLECKKRNLLIFGNATENENNMIFVDKSGLGKIEINKLISYLKHKLGETENKIKLLEKKKGEVSKIREEKADEIKKISHKRRLASDKVNILHREIASYQNYIEKIQINRKKNKQLKLISKISTEYYDMNISYCPICGTKIYSENIGCCKLCKSEITKISTPEENLRFLEDEKSSFQKILNYKQLELDKAIESLKKYKSMEKDLTEKLNYHIKTYYGEDINNYREHVSQADIIFKEIEKYKSLIHEWNLLDKLRKEIKTLNNENEEMKKHVKQYKGSKRDKKILDMLLRNFKNNISKLHLFKSETKKQYLNRIKLDQDENYSPYLDNVDLYGISSSSDNIRIILSYYLSLLQSSLEMDGKNMRFPNLLILDEPRQQNLDFTEIRNIIDLINSLPKKKWQIILTTYDEKDKNRSLFEKYFSYEMKNSKDFLIKKIN